MRIKKILLILLTLTFFIIPTSVVFADDATLKISAECAFVCDYSSGTVIYAKNENQKRPIASMTKIMMLNLIFENQANGNLKFDEKITVSKNASGMGGSQVFLQANKEYIVEDLVKSIIIASANDATVALAERIYGSESKAIEAMNRKASELGLTNTIFSNTTGLTKPTQYSSAKDVAKMLKELLQYESYYKFSSIYLDELTHPDGQITQLTNTNKLIKFYEGCDGGKTGFTNEAGYCLAATAKRGSMRVISVIINEPNSKTRFADCSNLFNYAFANYTSKQIISKNEATEYVVKIKKAKKDFYEVYAKNSIFLFGKINQKDDVKIEFERDSDLIAPLKPEAAVGKFIIYVNGVKHSSVDAIIREKAERKTIGDVMKDISSIN